MIPSIFGKDRRGFTLIELMIVIAIIGVLAAIAIPQFSAYRLRAFNSATMSDLKNVAIAQEAYHVDYETYSDSIATLINTVGINISPGVTISISKSNAAFTLEGYHTAGDKTYTLTGPGGVIISN